MFVFVLHHVTEVLTNQMRLLWVKKHDDAQKQALFGCSFTDDDLYRRMILNLFYCLHYTINLK